MTLTENGTNIHLDFLSLYRQEAPSQSAGFITITYLNLTKGKEMASLPKNNFSSRGLVHLVQKRDENLCSSWSKNGLNEL